MKRRLAKIVVFLFLGAIVNIAVAWGCAVARPFPGDNWSDTLAEATRVDWFYFPDEPGATAWQWHDIAAADGRGVGWETRCLSFFGDRDDRIRRISGDPPPRMLESVKLPDKSIHVEVLHSAAGWPFAVFDGAAVLDHDVEPYPALETWWCLLVPFGRTYEWWPAGPESAIEVQLTSGYQIVVPLRPIWPGFAINTIFYAVILCLLAFGPFAVRRFVRNKHGRCIKCGYDLGHADHRACPECGAAA